MTDHITPLPASELVRDMARTTGHSQVEIRKMLDAFEVIVARNARDGRGVRFPHLGTIDVREVPARTRMSFGKRVEVQAGKRVTFKPGKQLKDVLVLK